MARKVSYSQRKQFRPRPRPPAAAAADPTARTRYLVAETVLANAGRPDDLFMVESRCVGEHAYRVNLVREPEGGTLTREDSYYLVATPDGHVAYSNPTLERKFPILQG